MISLFFVFVFSFSIFSAKAALHSPEFDFEEKELSFLAENTHQSLPLTKKSLLLNLTFYANASIIVFTINKNKKTYFVPSELNLTTNSEKKEIAEALSGIILQHKVSSASPFSQRKEDSYDRAVNFLIRFSLDLQDDQYILSLSIKENNTPIYLPLSYSDALNYNDDFNYFFNNILLIKYPHICADLFKKKKH